MFRGKLLDFHGRKLHANRAGRFYFPIFCFAKTLFSECANLNAYCHLYLSALKYDFVRRRQSPAGRRGGSPSHFSFFEKHFFAWSPQCYRPMVCDNPEQL